MVCIYCGGETQVYNSRPQKRSNQIWRRRRCVTCGGTFTTEEIINRSQSWLVRRSSGATEPFSRDVLFLCLYNSLGHRKTRLPDAQGLVETIINKLQQHVAGGVIQTRAIADTTQVALNRFDTAASVYYQAHYQ